LLSSNQKGWFKVFIRHILSLRYLAIALVMMVVAASVYALAAKNTVAHSVAGDGAGIISPYEVSSIRYTLDKDNNPRDIRKVQFVVNPAVGSNAQPASTVHARIDTNNWVSCVNIGGSTWECSFNSPYPTVRLNPPTTLEVVAAQ
jgi:hypothetical protein